MSDLKNKTTHSQYDAASTPTKPELRTVYRGLRSGNSAQISRARARLLAWDDQGIALYVAFVNNRKFLPWLPAVLSGLIVITDLLAGHHVVALHIATLLLFSITGIATAKQIRSSEHARAVECIVERTGWEIEQHRIAALQTDNAIVRQRIVFVVTQFLNTLSDQDCRQLNRRSRLVLRGWLEGRHRYPALFPGAELALDLAVLRIAPLTGDPGFTKGARKIVRRTEATPEDPRYVASREALSALVAMRREMRGD